jgi:hypothetical protein
VNSGLENDIPVLEFSAWDVPPKMGIIDLDSKYVEDTFYRTLETV